MRCGLLRLGARLILVCYQGKTSDSPLRRLSTQMEAPTMIKLTRLAIAATLVLSASLSWAEGPTFSAPASDKSSLLLPQHPS